MCVKSAPTDIIVVECHAYDIVDSSFVIEKQGVGLAKPSLTANVDAGMEGHRPVCDSGPAEGRGQDDGECGRGEHGRAASRAERSHLRPQDAADGGLAGVKTYHSFL